MNGLHRIASHRPGCRCGVRCGAPCGSQRGARLARRFAVLVLLAAPPLFAGVDPTTSTPQINCFAETVIPHPADPTCHKGVDSLPCIDTNKRGDALPDLSVQCGWKRPTRSWFGKPCGRPQWKAYCL